MKNMVVFIISFVFWIVLCCILTVVVCGCSALPTILPDSPTSLTTGLTAGNTFAAALRSTDWLMSLLLMGAVAGLFAGLNGLKVGWAGIAACIGGLLLKAALSNAYVYWISGFLFVACLLVAIGSVTRKNLALSDIIRGVQKVRENVPDKEAVTQILAVHQSPVTQQLVKKMKGAMRIVGEL